MEALKCGKEVHESLEGTQCVPKDGRVIMPEICEKGHYCVQGEPRKCPAGTFCPAGSSKPLPCDSFELCPEGRALPDRRLNAMAKIALTVMGFALLVYALPCWALSERLRVLRFMAPIVGVALIWWFESTRKSPLNSPQVFFIMMLGLLFWGYLVSGRFAPYIGSFLGSVFDVAGLLALVFLICIYMRELNAAYFISLMIVAMAMFSEIFHGDLETCSQLLLVACFFLVNVLVIGVVISPFAALGYAVAGIIFAVYAILQFASDKLFLTARGAVLMPKTKDKFNPESVAGWAKGFAAQPFTHDDPETNGHRQKQPGVSFDFDGVSLLLPNGQRVLKDVSMSLPAGCSVAVMGPSGCGKSSITNVLSGRAGYGTVEGEITINGTYGEGMSVGSLRRVTGFVPQDDVMHRMLTVRQNCTFQAELRMPWDGAKDRSEREKRVNEEVDKVLQKLGIADKELQDTKIGDETARGVSGGQRKRVSIAMEFVAKPALLFLDEPTSGLDSTTSYAVMDCITSTARETHCTTVAVVHQPRYEMLLLFDRLVLLASGGFLVYSGPAKDAQVYFETMLGVHFPGQSNPADIMMDAISLESAQSMMAEGKMKPLLKGVNGFTHDNEALREQLGRRFAEEWDRRGRARYGWVNRADLDVPLPPLAPETVNWGLELWVQMKRALVQVRVQIKAVIFNNMLLAFSLLSYSLGAAPKSFQHEIYHPVVAVFMLMLTQGVAGMRIFGGVERYVAWREAGTGIRTILYFIGRDCAATLEIALAAGVFTAVYWPFGPLLVQHHVMYWVAFALAYCSYGLSYLLSVLFSESRAQLGAVVASALALIFAGFQPDFQTLASLAGGNGIFLLATSPIRWAYGWLMLHHIRAGAAFNNKLISEYMVGDVLNQIGFPVAWLSTTTDYKPCSLSVWERWEGNKSKGWPQVLFVCSLTQLFLLGAYLRFAAALSLLLVSKMSVAGSASLASAVGGTATQHREEDAQQAMRANMMGRLVRAMWLLFLVTFTHLETYVLLLTQ